MSIQTKIGTVTITIPTEVSEITLGQFLDLRKLGTEQDPLQVITILSGNETFQNLRFSERILFQVQDVMKLTNLLAESIKNFNGSIIKALPPDSVTILGKTIKVPQELEEQPFWPTRYVKSLIDLNLQVGTDDLINIFDKIIAHFLYVPYTQMTYNEQRAIEFESVVRELPLDAALRMGNFFLIRSARWWMPRRKYWALLIRLNSSRLVYKILKGLGISI